jgi:hypothetical protein
MWRRGDGQAASCEGCARLEGGLSRAIVFTHTHTHRHEATRAHLAMAAIR